MFGFIRKNKQESLPELPPPPSPPEFPMPQGDIPRIRSPDEMPEFPSAPSFDNDEEKALEIPEVPMPEMPEAPEPGLGEEIELPQMSDMGHAEPFVPEDAHEIETPETQQEEAPSFEVPERETVRRPVGPTFVSVDEYRTIMEHSDRVRSKLSEAEEFMHRLVEIKADEEKIFDKWRSQLEDIERKLGQIDRVIAKAKR